MPVDVSYDDFPAIYVKYMGTDWSDSVDAWTATGYIEGLEGQNAAARWGEVIPKFFEKLGGEWGPKIEQYKPEGDTDEQV